MAAESRLTLTVPRGKEDYRVTYDNATKVLEFAAPHHNVAAVTFGRGTVDGVRTAASLMPEFEAGLPPERLLGRHRAGKGQRTTRSMLNQRAYNYGTMTDDQPNKDPGPIAPEPTIRTPAPRIGDQPNKDPGSIDTESIKGGLGDATADQLNVDRGPIGNEALAKGSLGERQANQIEKISGPE